MHVTFSFKQITWIFVFKAVDTLELRKERRNNRKITVMGNRERIVSKQNKI